MTRIAATDIVGRFTCRTYSSGGRSIQPRCDLCGCVIKVDDGEAWTMVKVGVLHDLNGVICAGCESR